METKTAYIAWTNTDLTEGRGQQYPLVICELYSTAKRMGAKKYVQGSDCTVTETTLFKQDGRWYGPITVQPPTVADTQLDQQMKLKSAALEKARSLGLTEDELKLLGSTS